MTNRTIILIAFLTIALLFALPYLASAQSITNFKYEGFNNSTNLDEFSWDTVSDNGTIKFQVRGGGISNVWVVVDPDTTERSGGTTTVGIVPLQNSPGTQISYRVKVDNSSWSSTILLSFS